MTPDVITSDLKAVLRRLKLGRLLDTLPERLVLARQQQLPHQDFLLLATTADKMLKSLNHRASITPTSRRPANSSPSTRSSLTTSASTPSTRSRVATPTRSSSSGTARGPSSSPRIGALTSGSRPSPTPARAVGDRSLRQQPVRLGDRRRVLPQAPEADAGHAALTCGTGRI